MAKQTQQRKAAAQAVKAWCEAQGIEVQQIAHIYPRAYVLGKAAPRCMVLAVPWQDSEPLCKALDKLRPLQLISLFDEGLAAGMWCAAAYVVSPGAGQMVAVRFEE